MYQQNYNYYPQNQYVRQQPIPQQQQSFLRGRMVSSIEEARASAIDFDGSVFYFPDLANKRIYTKQINMDGTATLSMYVLQPIPAPAELQPAQDYITRKEFEKVISQLKNPVTNAEDKTQTAKAELLEF